MRRTSLFVIMSFLVGLGVGLFARSARTRYPALAPIESLAVLPLETLSGDPEQDNFAEGMTEALTTELTKISRLRVISPLSTMHYRITQESARQIAYELKVDSIVEGSIFRVGNQVHITVRLVHTPTGRQLWAGTYQGKLGDIPPLKSEVARAIANEIPTR